VSKAAAGIPADIAALGFEEAQAELEKVVRQLEDQHTGLDEALKLWERGEQLHAHCQAKLDYAAERIAQLQIDATEAKKAQAEHDGAFDDSTVDPSDGDPLPEEAAPSGTPSMF
jgi:exodeoxyribonuclease VII small subunit